MCLDVKKLLVVLKRPERRTLLLPREKLQLEKMENENKRILLTLKQAM